MVETWKESKEVNPSIVSIVFEFLDVFLEELPKLSPKKELEFSIYLL